MDKQNYIVSKELSKLDLNKHTDDVDLYTYWCRVVYADYEHWNPKEHAHSFWELHLCLSGKCRILVDGTEYVLSENTYLFLIPRSMHTILFESNDYSEFVWGFSIENNKGTNDMLCDKYKNTGIMSADNQMLSSVSLILDNVRNAEYGSYNIIKNELHHIFVIMARKVGFQKDGMHRKIMNKELELIRKYICENMFLDDSDIFFLRTCATIKAYSLKDFE